MRPVNKWLPGWVTLSDGSPLKIEEDYHPYRKAKRDLCKNLGLFCSYCEKGYQDERDLAVEHVQPRKYKDEAGNMPYECLEAKWSNFLISCATCNGADNKDTKNVEYGNCHLPHLNNTYLSLKYDKGGVVTVNPDLQGKSRDNAQHLLELVGLDKGPRNSSDGDKRWMLRKDTWDLAERYLNMYRRQKITLDVLLDLVKAYGYWSIWFTVFKTCDEVRAALINEFPGTAQECFDAKNHYEPVARHPEYPSDPI